MYQRDFTIEEFRGRRDAVCEAIGDATALIAGAPMPTGLTPFRQYNDFYYLCGIEVPQSYLMLDGGTGKATLFLPEGDLISVDNDDPILSADVPDYVKEITGVDAVCKRDQLFPRLERISTLYTFMRNGEGLQECLGSLGLARHAIEADPCDGHPDRGAWFCQKLASQYSNLEIRDLAPIIYSMRLIKSDREISLLQRAGQLSALGLCDAMRATAPGVMEYQLAAVLQYHYIAGGARDYSYIPIVGGGKNAYYGHYHANSAALSDGDLVLVDCAPDYHYYTSDITRMWPVNGTFTSAQRALYGFVTAYHQTLLAGIRPGRTCDEIEEEAIEIMRSRLGEFNFATASHASGAEWMFNFRGHLSHSVGMSVHDGGGHKKVPLQPGMVFSVDPQMKIDKDRLYLRVEDTGVVTEDGFDAFTKDAPYELDDIEATMRGDVVVKTYPLDREKC
jgi:Xaa-Pro aminopeptidase